MARGRETFEKRRLQKVRQERKIEKANRREMRKDEAGNDVPDEETLMEQYRIISEQHSAGALSSEDYEAQRKEIFAALGFGEDM